MRRRPSNVLVCSFFETEGRPEAPGHAAPWKESYSHTRAQVILMSAQETRVKELVLHTYLQEEQKRRFLEIIEKPEKNWKFSIADAKERLRGQEVMDAYEDSVEHTSTKWAPWYLIPADHKWFTRVAVSDVLLKTLRPLNLSYPIVSKERKAELEKIRRRLEQESDRESKEGGWGEQTEDCASRISVDAGCRELELASSDTWVTAVSGSTMLVVREISRLVRWFFSS